MSCNYCFYFCLIGLSSSRSSFSLCVCVCLCVPWCVRRCADMFTVVSVCAVMCELVCGVRIAPFPPQVISLIELLLLQFTLGSAPEPLSPRGCYRFSSPLHRAEHSRHKQYDLKSRLVFKPSQNLLNSAEPVLNITLWLWWPNSAHIYSAVITEIQRFLMVPMEHCCHVKTSNLILLVIVFLPLLKLNNRFFMKTMP